MSLLICNASSSKNKSNSEKHPLQLQKGEKICHFLIKFSWLLRELRYHVQFAEDIWSPTLPGSRVGLDVRKECTKWNTSCHTLNTSWIRISRYVVDPQAPYDHSMLLENLVKLAHPPSCMIEQIGLCGSLDSEWAVDLFFLTCWPGGTPIRMLAKVFEQDMGF